MLRGATPYLLILPSFLLAAAIILWPVGEIVTLASHDVNRFGMVRAFIGFANFQELFADPDFFDALWRTLVWTVAVVLGTLVVSTPIALILNEDFYGRRRRAHADHAALGDLADHDGDRLALGAQRRERHAQFRPARPGHPRAKMCSGWRRRQPRFPCRS